MARSIAEAGKGVYVTVDNSNNAQTVIENELDKLNKDEQKTEIFTKYKEQFIAVAILLLIVLVIDTVISIILDSLSRKGRNRDI